MAGSLLIEYLTTTNVVGVVAISCIAALLVHAFSRPAYPQFQWVGEGRGILAWIKGNVTYLFHYADWVDDGYKKVALFYVLGRRARRLTNNSTPKTANRSSFLARQRGIR
jgi:hypothetical protein